MQVILTEEEYNRLKSALVNANEYQSWLVRMKQAEIDFGKQIIRIVKPYIENNPDYSINPEQIVREIRSAFKPLSDELSNYPKPITETPIIGTKG